MCTFVIRLVEHGQRINLSLRCGSLQCFKFFLRRLADLEWVLQQEENREEVNTTRVEMYESLMEEVAVEEQEVMKECKVAEKQRVSLGKKRGRSKGEKRGRIGLWV